MAVHRMRTIDAAVDEIRGFDADSAITSSCIRRLCKNERVRCVYSGKKILVDMDAPLELLNGDEVAYNPDPTK